MAMDPLDDHGLVLGLDDLATSTLHGICSVIGVLNISRQYNFKFTKKSGLLPLCFILFLYLFIRVAVTTLEPPQQDDRHAQF